MADALNSLQNTYGNLQSSLVGSPTAYGGEQAASSSDIAAQKRLMTVQDQIQKLRDQQLKDSWGLNTAQATTGDTSSPAGPISTALDYLARPLYGVVGAAETLAGKGVTSSLGGNITENITKGKRTFGDLLKKEGVPYAISAPLGFALDVAMDPINWATAGTTAFVPRVATGLIRGTAEGGVSQGVRAAAAGVRSSLPGVIAARTVKATSKLPYLSETGVGQTMARATDVAAESALSYDKLTARDFLGSTLTKQGVGVPMSDYRITLGDLAKHAVHSLPNGQNIWNGFEYSNPKWLRMVRLKDALLKAEGIDSKVSQAATRVQEGASVEAATAPMREVIESKTPSSAIDWYEEGNQIGNSVPTHEIDKDFQASLNRMGRPDAVASVGEAIQDAKDIAYTPQKMATADAAETAMRLASEYAQKPIFTLDEVRKLVNEESVGETGVQWLDNMMKNVRDMKVSTNSNINRIAPAIKSTLDFYDKWLTLFRAAKVTGSPSSWMNATIGNPSFYGMLGGDMSDVKWWKMLTSAAGYQMGTKKSSSFFKRMMDVPQIRQYFEDNPTAIRTAFAIPNTDRQKMMTAEQLLRIAKDHGMIGMDAKITDEGVMKEISTVMASMKKAVAEGKVESGKSGGIFGKIAAEEEGMRGGLHEARKVLAEKGSSATRYDLPTGMFSQEYMESDATRKMLATVEQNAKNGSWAWKALDAWLNKAPSLYEGIDQSYKLGTFGHLTLNGISERELNIMRRTVKLAPEDIMDKWNDNGIWKYRIAPDKAMEMVMESYLNYAAMPSYVRLMRNLPLLGAPFVSFSYGAGLKTANTLVNNPAFFNKVQFAMNDFGGSKSPLEKEALAGPYYNYLNQQTMFKLPFFEQNPLYVNLGYALPYYSLNAFAPSGRAYSEILPNALVQTIDKSQLMGNPVGQVLFDYAILPSILSYYNEDPTGSFGQKLYPNDATAGTKAFYAGRQLAESVVPGFTSIPGGLAQGITAPGMTDYIPSYRWRQIAHATQGQDQYGISRQEPAASRTLRGVLAAIGIPVQAPINLQNISKNTK